MYRASKLQTFFFFSTSSVAGSKNYVYLCIPLHCIFRTLQIHDMKAIPSFTQQIYLDNSVNLPLSACSTAPVKWSRSYRFKGLSWYVHHKSVCTLETNLINCSGIDGRWKLSGQSLHRLLSIYTGLSPTCQCNAVIAVWNSELEQFGPVCSVNMLKKHMSWG